MWMQKFRELSPCTSNYLLVVNIYEAPTKLFLYPHRNGFDSHKPLRWKGTTNASIPFHYSGYIPIRATPCYRSLDPPFANHGTLDANYMHGRAPYPKVREIEKNDPFYILSNFTIS